MLDKLYVLLTTPKFRAKITRLKSDLISLYKKYRNRFYGIQSYGVVRPPRKKKKNV